MLSYMLLALETIIEIAVPIARGYHWFGAEEGRLRALDPYTPYLWCAGEPS
jgi:hypothetical protein